VILCTGDIIVVLVVFRCAFAGVDTICWVTLIKHVIHYDSHQFPWFCGARDLSTFGA
jgi:hypothetical protein